MKNRRSGMLTAFALGVVLAAAVAAPTAVYASHRFSDVPDDSAYAGAVSYLADRGITGGCGDGTRYCPRDAVTRGQMALFLERLSGNGAVAPSVNAATVAGLTPAQLRGQGALSGLEVVSVDRLFTSGTLSFFGSGTASCPGGKKVLGGGMTMLVSSPLGGGPQPGTSSGGELLTSFPTADGTGWTAAVNLRLSGGLVGFRVYATCATP
jgi:hypothetical protein